MQDLFLQELIMLEQRGEICPAIQACSQLMPRSLLPQVPLNRSTEGLPKSPVINSHTSCLESPYTAFRVFPGCVSNGKPICCMSVAMTADMCPRTYLHLVVGLLAIIAIAIFAQMLPIFGPGSVIVLPKYQSLPNEITRDLNCWVGIGMQKCNCRGQTPASTSALCSFRRSGPRLLDPRWRCTHRHSSISFLRPGPPFSRAARWLASKSTHRTSHTSRSSSRLGPSLGHGTTHRLS